VSYTSAKPLSKTTLIENERFWYFNGQRYPVFELNGQNQTLVRAGWPKNGLYSFINT
jgi:hypothetical protein